MITIDLEADDATLLQCYAARRDPSAFAELVRRYADLVYATARRVTGSPSVAEDVAQDCFLSLAVHSGGIRGSLGSWLHKTSLNRSLEVLRSESARKRREAEVAATVKPEPADSAEIISLVDEAIAELPDELRVAVTEHFLCGRSQTELAAALGVNQSTVSRRVDTGLEKIRKKLSERGIAAVALAILPALLSDSAHAKAPSGVQLASMKIGLSGVGGGVAAGIAAGSGAGGVGALTKVASALLLLTAAAAGTAYLAHQQMTPIRGPRKVAVPAGGTTVQAATDDDDDDHDDAGDRDDADADHDVTTPTSQPQPR